MNKTNELADALGQLGIEKQHMGTSTGLKWWEYDNGKPISSYSPVNGEAIANVSTTPIEGYEHVVAKAHEGFKEWRQIPAPHRGEIIRQIGNQLRAHKRQLGILVSYEMGKVLEEGLGEVQEMIDICDFATGLSRQLYGLTMTSERANHRMMEQWHPLGPVAVITAFNFPVAVYAWNAFVAAVCGNSVVWKPSEKTPLCAVAVQRIMAPVLQANQVPEGVFGLINGGSQLGSWMAEDRRFPLVSATGSVRMGRSVGSAVAARLGRSLLELGGNNALIITPQADLDLALRAVVFGAVGTAGQRCTTTRRVIVHDSLFDSFKKKLLGIYAQLTVGNPLKGHLVGPLIDKSAVEHFTKAIERAKSEGGVLLCGGKALEGPGFEGGCYVVPAIVEAKTHMPILREETFAPLLYLIRYQHGIEEAIALQNDVPQGLSSAIFSNHVREVEHFLSAQGSDCGIANVNIGTSGAEIGGAFGGEKDTGGGRESGSDSWKAYMRRQTNTVNYGQTLPLAQGIRFDF
jgi:aldehyde dehydrogenase (NAD+)